METRLNNQAFGGMEGLLFVDWLSFTSLFRNIAFSFEHFVVEVVGDFIDVLLESFDSSMIEVYFSFLAINFSLRNEILILLISPFEFSVLSLLLCSSRHPKLDIFYSFITRYYFSVISFNFNC